MDISQLPQRPQTTCFLPLEAKGRNDIFSFLVMVPSGIKFSVTSKPIKSGEYLALELAKDYSIRVVDELLKRGANADVNFTNWTSATAAIQKLIIDFNVKKRNAENDQSTIES